MRDEGAHGNTGLASERVRARMVERLRELGIRDGRVLAAMAAVQRHLFVDPALASRAYEDTALPIGLGQTISRPYVVARMIELALEGIAAARSAKVLEIGTGCGYAAAVLAQSSSPITPPGGGGGWSGGGDVVDEALDDVFAPQSFGLGLKIR